MICVPFNQKVECKKKWNIFSFLRSEVEDLCVYVSNCCILETQRMTFDKFCCLDLGLEFLVFQWGLGLHFGFCFGSFELEVQV